MNSPKTLNPNVSIPNPCHHTIIKKKKLVCTNVPYGHFSFLHGHIANVSIPITHKYPVWTHNNVYRVWTHSEVFLYGHTPKSYVWRVLTYGHTHTNVMYGLTIMFPCMDTHTNLMYGHTMGFQVWTHNKLHHVWTHQLCMEFSCMDTHTLSCMGFSCMNTHAQMLCMDTHFIRFFKRFIMYGHTIRFSCIDPLLGLSSMDTHTQISCLCMDTLLNSWGSHIWTHTQISCMDTHTIYISVTHFSHMDTQQGLACMDTT